MQNLLEIENLCKNYPSFKLDNVSFNLQKGKITGFIGRNGAGKTTTIKSILNLINKDNGKISIFGKDFLENQSEIKQRIGFVSGGVNYFQAKKLKLITAVTKNFYSNWNEEALKNYMSLFNLDENKTPKELSEGMKVKYSLALALSHNAELLILDEPTSGLDPISRDELLDIFLDLADKGITIFFSTHITSDLDKCADNIIYIKSGRIIANSDMRAFISQYRVVEFPSDKVPDDLRDKIYGLKRTKAGYAALIKEQDIIDGLTTKEATLEDIMVHLDKEDI